MTERSWRGRRDHLGGGKTDRHTIPLCHRDAPGYRPDGNCRVCMVEIKGERVLAPSCLRTPMPDMQVTGSERARKARRMVLELLLADQPPRARRTIRTRCSGAGPTTPD